MACAAHRVVLCKRTEDGGQAALLYRPWSQMELGAKGARELDERMAAMKAEARQRAERAQRVDVREEKIDQVGVGWGRGE